MSSVGLRDLDPAEWHGRDEGVDEEKADGDPLPKHLNVGSHAYEIVWSTDKVLEYSRASGEDQFGLCKPGEGVIYIADNRPMSFLKETLVHEWLHLLVWEGNIEVPENKKDSAHDREEKLVGQLSGLLLHSIQMNEPVITWLMSED